ncbi:DNA-binding protein [Cupriavidus basilensis]|uniref:DNA-binding protein n=1 Tax=Cupriavidus basilensis TaxID=68895 RepID=UPI0039F6759E
MARPGISYEEVKAAAEELVAEQQKPTLRAVRERLGGGSPNAIHRHWTAWQGRQKPPTRTLPEPNPRLLAALGAELSKVAEEAGAEANAELGVALRDLAEYAARGEAMEAELTKLQEQLAQLASERDTLAGKASEQADEISRLQQEAERGREEMASVRRILAQAELRLEAVPRLEREAGDLREQLEQARAARVEAEKLAAVAEAQRAGEQAAQLQAEARLVRAEEREQQSRKDLADAIAAHQLTRERLVESVGLASAAQAELKQYRVQDDAKGEPTGEKDKAGGAGTRARKTPAKS